MSHWRDLLMLNKLRAPVGNMRIFIRILHIVQSADSQSADPHFTRRRVRNNGGTILNEFNGTHAIKHIQSKAVVCIILYPFSSLRLMLYGI